MSIDKLERLHNEQWKGVPSETDPAAAAAAAGIDTAALERRWLALKGRTEPMDTFVLIA